MQSFTACFVTLKLSKCCQHLYNTTNHIPSRYKINTSAFEHYWKHGAGKQLLQQLGYTPDISKADAYKPYLFQVDEEADTLATLLFNELSFSKTLELVKHYVHHKPVTTEHKKILDNFFEKIHTNPAWLNIDKVEKGAALSRRTGIPGLLVLRNYCLMGGYESAAINKPLIYTGALKKAQQNALEIQLFFGLVLHVPVHLKKMVKVYIM